MRLKAVVEGLRAGVTCEVVLSVENGMVTFEVPSVARANSVRFEVDHAQLDGALDTLTAQEAAAPAREVSDD